MFGANTREYVKLNIERNVKGSIVEGLKCQAEGKWNMVGIWESFFSGSNPYCAGK